MISNVNVYGIEESIVASGFPMNAEFDSEKYEGEVRNLKKMFKQHNLSTIAWRLRQFKFKLKDGQFIDHDGKGFNLVWLQEGLDDIFNDHIGRSVDLGRAVAHIRRAMNLGKTNSGEGHDCMLKGIVVQWNWGTPVLMQPQIQRYHFIDIISSQSAMHRITNRTEFSREDFSGISDVVLNELNDLLDGYHYHKKLGNKDAYTEIWRMLIDNLPQSYIKTARFTANYLQLKTMYNQRKNHKLGEWKEFCDWCESLPHFRELCLKVVDA